MNNAQADILTVHGVTKRFAVGDDEIEALAPVDLAIPRSEFVCLIGASGCGKSTLLRIIAGFEEPTTGDVSIDGKAITGPGSDRGMVFQDYALFPWMTVRENISFGPRQRQLPREEIDKTTDEFVRMVGLERFVDRYPNQLSGGMKQRVAIVRALANQPRILLMDEPFGALDAQTRCRMQAHLLEIWRKIDITIVFITHDLDEAIFLADRILVLSAHPGEVRELIEVPVPRPRSAAQLISPAFLATKARLEELIHQSKSEHDEEAESYAMVARLTDVSDNVD